MIRRIAERATGRATMIAAGLMLAVAGLAALPAVQADAATSSVVSYWGASHYEDSGGQYECGTAWESSQGANQVDEVYNPCNTRAWVHYYADGSSTVQSYCINPGGGLAYDIPLRWSSAVTFTNIQLTSNTSACDAGATATVTWETPNLQSAGKTYDCTSGDTFTYFDFGVGGIVNNCNFRIWLHGSHNSTACLNPSGGSNYPGYYSPYSQLQMTAVQAPCAAGAPPYPY